MDGFTPRFQINLIVDNADKKKKVYNLNKNKRIILNPSYLNGTDDSSSSYIDNPTKPPPLTLGKLKHTNVILLGNSNKDSENTFCPSRTHSSIWNRIRGSWPMRSGKSMTIDSDCKIVKIISEKDSVNEVENESCDLSEYDVQQIIKHVLREQLHAHAYDHEKCKDQSAALSLEIHDRLKVLCHDVYKIVVNVFLGEVRGDGIETATQCVWNAQSDCIVSGFYKNTSIIAVATVFASYSL